MKVGRNDPCPCGSGKKYKKCHDLLNDGAAGRHVSMPSRELLERKLAEFQALQTQRERQQGLGHPIISEVLNGYRIVAVGNEIHWSREWKTFHDFLLYYTWFQTFNATS